MEQCKETQGYYQQEDIEKQRKKHYYYQVVDGEWTGHGVDRGTAWSGREDSVV